MKVGGSALSKHEQEDIIDLHHLNARLRMKYKSGYGVDVNSIEVPVHLWLDWLQFPATRSLHIHSMLWQLTTIDNHPPTPLLEFSLLSATSFRSFKDKLRPRIPRIFHIPFLADSLTDGPIIMLQVTAQSFGAESRPARERTVHPGAVFRPLVNLLTL